MTQRPIKTKLMGTAPDQRNPLAPPEIIYAVEEPVPLKRFDLAGWLFAATMLALLVLAVLGQFVDIIDRHRIVVAAPIIGVMLALAALGPERINSIAPYVRPSAKPMRSPLWARVLFPIMFAFFAYMIFRTVTESTQVELAWLAALLTYTGLLYWASWRVKRIRHKHRRYRGFASVMLLIALVGGYWLFFSLRDWWLT
jgi:hypothetical protein